MFMPEHHLTATECHLS